MNIVVKFSAVPCFCTVRPFLTQSDSASRKRPFSTGLFFDWILVVLLLIVSRVDFIVFMLFLEAVGVRGSTAVLLYGSRKSVGSSVICALLASNARFARDEPSFKRVGGVGLEPEAAKATFVALRSAESRESYSRRSRCWQNGIDTARCCRRVIHAAGERNQECATLTCGEKQQQ